MCVHCASTLDSVASLPPERINLDGVAIVLLSPPVSEESWKLQVCVHCASTLDDVASVSPKRVRSAGVCPLCIYS
jgi:hypothetical protein